MRDRAQVIFRSFRAGGKKKTARPKRVDESLDAILASLVDKERSAAERVLRFEPKVVRPAKPPIIDGAVDVVHEDNRGVAFGPNKGASPAINMA